MERKTMLTEEDFENVEEAINIIDCCPRGLRSRRKAEETLYNFAKKVLSEARRDFLTEENPPSQLEARVKNLEASAENTRAALERLCKILAWKVPPCIFGTEACDVIEIARGEK